MQHKSPLTETTDVPATVAPRSLADLKLFVLSHPDLDDIQRRDMASAIESLAAYLRQPPESLPADGRKLRHRVERLHHEQLGISRKRLDNVVGGVKRALKLASARFPGARRRTALAPAWARLRDALPAKSKYVYHLSGFIAFCSRAGVAPNAVDDATFEAFFQDVQATSLRKDPRRAYRNACKWWNAAVDAIPGWPHRRVTVPSFKSPPETIPLEQFPESFRADLDALKTHLASADPFRGKSRRRGPDGKPRRARRKPYKDSTIATWMRLLHGAASMLVTSGYCCVDDVDSIASLCAPAAAEAILTGYWQKAGGKATHHTALVAKVLKIIAEIYLDAPENQLADLAENIRDLSPEETGLTEKNLARLRQLAEPANVLLLLDAPETLRARAAAQEFRRKRNAIDLMIGAAVAVLLYAPVRLGNLTNISLTRNLRWPAREGEPGYLHFPKGEVKNDQDLDFELPPPVVELLRSFLGDARHRWLGPADDRLFPFGESEQSRRYFSSLISGRLATVTGLEINTHLFRHIAAKLYLDENPGDYETVRLLLGHKQLRTTIRFYCGFEREAAVRHYDATVLKLHDSLRGDPATGTGRRRQRRKRAQQGDSR